MTNWITEHPDSALSLVGVFIAAFAATWSAIVSHKQWRLTLKEQRHHLPEMFVEAEPVIGHPGWTRLLIRIDNKANVDIDVLTFEVTKPAGTRILPWEKAHIQNRYNEFQLRGTLPDSETVTALAMDRTLPKAGTAADRHDTGDRMSGEIYVHRSPSSWGSKPSSRFTLRWRDSQAQKFTVPCTVTMSASTINMTV
jgi:hypothetical protein